MVFHSSAMRLNFKEGVGYLTFPALESYPFVRHAFSTRLGGVSKDEFFSMNLSFHRGDPDENVLENYRRICGAAGFPYEGLTASAQDHHTFIRRVGRQDRGVGIFRPRDLESVDGLVTDEPDVVLVTYYADCVPLYFLDPEKRVIGLAHGGWRGTAGRIGRKMVEKMKAEYGCRPERIIGAIGPSIGACCYEVDEPVAREFLALSDLETERFVMDKKNGKYSLDLWEANRQIMVRAGMRPENITVTDLCTRCNHDWLISHRATGGKRGGMAAMMCLVEQCSQAEEKHDRADAGVPHLSPKLRRQKGKRERTRLLPHGCISQGSQSGPPFLGGAMHQRNERIWYCVFQWMFPSVRLLPK